MSRFAPTALVLALLAATAAAFALAQHLKLEPAPIAKPAVTRTFSPVCECDSSQAYIRFTLRKPDALTVLITNADGEAVRHLAAHDVEPRGPVLFIWNGLGDDGSVLPDGVYRPRVHLDRENRTFDLPNPIRVDATPPTVTLVSAKPRTISPDRDGRSDKISIRYRVDEPARVSLYVDGVRRVRVRGVELTRKFDWNGRIDGAFAPARYRLALVARDLAGNVSAPSATFNVHVRFVELRPRVVRVTAGTRFGLRVDTDAPRVSWRIGPRRGVSAARPFVARAPARPGVYTLVVHAAGHTARARVVATRG